MATSKKRKPAKRKVREKTLKPLPTNDMLTDHPFNVSDPFDVYGTVAKRLAAQRDAALDHEVKNVFNWNAYHGNPKTLTGWELWRLRMVNLWHDWKPVFHLGNCHTEDW